MEKQTSFLSLANTKKLKCEKFLDEMSKVIPWQKYLDILSPLYHSNSKTGRKKKELLMMLKIYFLQQWYSLSDPGVEEAIYDRNSFQRFLDIDLMQEKVPDETTILGFRHFMEENGLQEEIFEYTKELLIEKGLMMKEGTIVDATIILAPSSTKNKDKKRDPEMSSTKKNDQWYFGMKAHIGVDAKSGLVHTVVTSTAKVSDIQKMDELIHGEEKAILGDKGYFSDERKRVARKQSIFWGVLDKQKGKRKLSKGKKYRNKKLSVIRAKV